MITTGTAAFWRSTFALCLGSIVVFSNLYITQPLLPMLSEAFAVSPLQAGMTLSATTLTLGFCLLIFGPLSDAIGRRAVILGTLALLCLTTFAGAFASDYASLLFVRALQGVFIAGLPAAAMAFMGDEFDQRALLFATGLYIGANSLGGIGGRLISGVAAAHWGWQSSFWVLALFDLSCLLLVARLLPAACCFTPRSLHPLRMLGDLARHLRHPLLLTAYLIGGLNFFIFVNQYSYITFVLADAPYHWTTDALGLLFLTYLSGTLAATFSGRLVAKRSQALAMALGIAVLMLGSLLTLLPSLAAIIGGLCINALGFFFAHAQVTSWVARHATQARGSATALYLTFYYTGATFGGVYLAPFWDAWAWPGVVAGSWLVLCVTLSLSLWLRGRERQALAQTALLEPAR
jgi:YNFM family putative membrane transporter